MAVSIKTEQEIERMREACRLLSIVHEELGKMIRPGISTYEIDQEGERLIRSLGGTPNFLHYNGYPASICVSVNEEVVHGIPKKNRILQEGDIVSLDAGLIRNGYHSDAARTYAVGEISGRHKALIEAAKESFFRGIEFAKPGCYLNDICSAIGAYAESLGFGVVRELTGHGIGTHLHEDPMIPNYSMNHKGIRLMPGMTLAIEPMITAGSAKVKWMPDKWTVVTKDHSYAAHYENTVLITEGDPQILTLSPDETAAEQHGR